MKSRLLYSLTALAVASCIASGPAPAASLGPIAIQSGHHQAFAAEIVLQPSAGENPNELGVRLASPEKFDEHGLAWHYQFSQLQLHSQPQADGSILIKIGAEHALNIQNMALLLEITRPQGSQYQTTQTSNSDSLHTLLKNQQSTGFNPESLSPDQTHYGPIQATDTLWSIARHMARQHGISTKNMLDNLYRSNPEAFHNGRMDVMKPGAILRLATDVGPRQHAESSKAIVPSTANKPLDLLAPATETATPEALPNDHGKTAITNPGQPNAGEGDYLFLQTRVETLEQQINMMQQLLTLKDQQLTQLQNNVEQQLQQQTQFMALSLISSLLAVLSLGLGWLLWRKQPAATPIPSPPAQTSLIFPSPAPATPHAAALAQRDTAAEDDFGFDFDPSKHLPPKIDRDSAVEDWAVLNDEENKIDLARAYFDMGDMEMAKQVAEEVLNAGTLIQQHQAKLLLNDITSRVG